MPHVFSLQIIFVIKENTLERIHLLFSKVWLRAKLQLKKDFCIENGYISALLLTIRITLQPVPHDGKQCSARQSYNLPPGANVSVHCTCNMISAHGNTVIPRLTKIIRSGVTSANECHPGTNCLR